MFAGRSGLRWMPRKIAGSESLKALRKQAKAQSKEAKAETFEQQQKAAQRAKSA